MSWNTLQLMQGFGDTLDNSLKARADRKSLAARKEIEGPKLGIPNMEELNKAQEDLNIAQKGLDETKKKWSDMIDINNSSVTVPSLSKAEEYYNPTKPQAEAYDPLQFISKTPGNMQNIATMEDANTRRNQIQAKQKAAWEKYQKDTANKTLADRATITPEYQERAGITKEKQATYKTKKDKRDEAQALNRKDWEDLIIQKQNESRDNGDTPGTGGTSASQLARWNQVVQDRYLMARANPNNPTLYRAYREAVQNYNAFGGHEEVTAQDKLEPLNEDERKYLINLGFFKFKNPNYTGPSD